MATPTGVINLAGTVDEDWQLTFKLSGAASAALAAAAVGKALELDTSADNTVKLATDGGVIFGYAMAAEYRQLEGITVVTVSLSGVHNFPLKTGETVNVGDSIQGAGAGEVKALPVTSDTNTNAGAIASAKHDWNNIVIAVGTAGYATTVLK